MKWLTLPTLLLLTACQGGKLDGVMPYSAQTADALSRDGSACASQGFSRDSEAYLNCIRKLGDDQGYWLLTTPDRLNFLARPAGYQRPATPFITTGGRLATDPERARPKEAVPQGGSQPVDMTGTWNVLRSGAQSCSFQQTGNLLNGFCKNQFVEGPVIGSVDGRRVGWRWLHQVGAEHFTVELFAADMDPGDNLHGYFQVHRVYDRFHPDFDYQYSTPPEMRLSPFFEAHRQSAGPVGSR